MCLSYINQNTEGFSVAYHDYDDNLAGFKAFLDNNEIYVIGDSGKIDTEPIDPADLEWLRNLTLLPGESLFVTDNHGRDVSYLMSDFINLGKVGA